MGDNILVFAEDWGKHPSSTQHIIKQLAKQHNIIWVNSIGLRQPRLSRNDLIRLWHKLKAVIVKPSPSLANDKTVSRCLFPVISLLTIPAPQSDIARYIAKKIIFFQLSKVLKRHQFFKPVLWVSLPTVVDLVGMFDERKLVYYCGDDFSSLAGIDHLTVTKRENELVFKADLIFTVSLRLMNKFPKEKTILLPHGVDYDLFSSPFKKNKWFNSKRKVAGFYGSLSEWFNIELMKKVAGNLSDWDFLLIGKADIDIRSLTNLINVYHLPAVNHNELPSYSQHWTVSILPFRDNEQIRACNPLKLREYLAAGKPIVSTWYPALESYKNHLYIANNAEQFISSLKQASQQTDDNINILRKLVVNDTWDSRAQMVAKEIGLHSI